MNQIITSNINQREVFNNAVNSLQNAFIDTPGFIASNYKLTEGFLRSEVGLVAGVTNYTFNIMVNQTQPQPFNTEKRLNLQDSFVCSSIGFFVGLPASATDAAWLPFTYPNLALFGANAVPMNTLYNGGSMRITVNNNVLVPDWDLYRHLIIPETQSDIAAGTPPPSVRLDQKSGFDGFYPNEPNIVFVGSKNNQIVVTLPAGLATVSANSRAILWFRGILAQNTTVVS